jgi:hypothetical protein
MDIKKCGKCHQTKNICEFTKDKNRIDGLYCYCKTCKRIVAKKEYKKNKLRILNYQKQYYVTNKTEIIKRVSSDYSGKKEEKLNYQKKYYQKNVEKKLDYAKKYRNNNKEKRNAYETNRKKTDIIYKLKHLVRNRINKFLVLKKFNKKNKAFEIIGCTPQELKVYLEQKFIRGMCWENQGEWHIDHIIPLSSASNEEELYKLCHFTNLQPLWAEDNIRKGGKLIYGEKH